MGKVVEGWWKVLAVLVQVAAAHLVLLLEELLLGGPASADERAGARQLERALDCAAELCEGDARARADLEGEAVDGAAVGQRGRRDAERAHRLE